MNRLILLMPLLMIPLGACGSDSSDETFEVIGNLTYPQRIALVPGGTATVALEDVSIADAAATVIAEESIELVDQQVPIPFQLDVDAADLEPTGTYSVRAEIRGPDGTLNWTTDTANLVDPEDGDIDLGDLVLVPVDSSGDGAEEGAAGPLSGVWNVTEIDGSPVLEEAPATLEFSADGTLSGTTGCNSYTTGFEVDGDLLVVSEIAVTAMACIGEVSDQEAAFLAVLGDSPTFALVDTDVQLIIEGSSGSTLVARR